MTDETQTNDASAAFESGFSNARGDSQPAAEKPAEKAQPAETKPAESARQDAKKVEPDPWEGVAPKIRETLEGLQTKLAGFEKLPARFSVVEGHIGNLNLVTRSLKAAMEKANEKSTAKGQEAPSNTEVQRAMKDPARWTQLEQDYPDWVAAVKPEFDDLRAAIAATKSEPFDPAPLEKKFDERITKTTADFESQFEARLPLYMKHGNWKATVRSEEFKAWRATQPQDVNALGASENPDDAVRMLDLYSADRKKAAEKTAREESRKKQLERAVTPDGVSVTTHQPSAEDAFEAGFKSARG